jgi:uncharacterized protein YsxB (DUF464 family)
MVVCDFLKDPKGELLGFVMEGHAGSGREDKGEEIVCAAVSSAAYLVVNTITDVLHAEAVVDTADGRCSLKLPSGRAYSSQPILEGFKLHMLGLEEQYPKIIKVRYQEV